MLDKIKAEFLKYSIDCIGAIPLSHCKVQKPYKLERVGFDLETELYAVIFAIPYYTKQKSKNISSYAVACDYHLFCRELFADIIPRLSSAFPQNLFCGFADDSPIDERHAAALAGLGILGDNGLLITEKYSSYVFLGEIITDLQLELHNEYKLLHCESCGSCRAACPAPKIGECLSALTQKKGELAEKERRAVKQYGSAWGCDICAEVCPHTKKAMENGTIYTPIPFFTKELIPILSYEMIDGMSDGDFSRRAYSWRKKATVLRNLKLLEAENDEGRDDNA